MKRILSTLCALAIVMAGSATALAAEPEAGQSASYYPIAVEEYTAGDFDELRVNKTYQLSLSDDPSLIPTEDFVRNDRRYYLLDMTRKDEVGVDTKPYTKTITKPSKTNNMEQILQQLEGELEVTTEDGYTGLLTLDHTSVKVAVDGYATKNRTVTATRSYPNLSDADLSFVPKTIQENGRTLSLADVQWATTNLSEGEGVVQRYCATASYTGTASSKYATGYIVTANYTGEVAKTGCDIVTYTAIFGSEKIPEESKAPDSNEPHDPDPGQTENPDSTEAPNIVKEPVDLSGLKHPALISAGVLILGAGGVFAVKKFRGRR